MKPHNKLLLCAFSSLLAFSFSSTKLSAQAYPNQINIRAEGSTIIGLQYGRSFLFRDSSHMEFHIGLGRTLFDELPPVSLTSEISAFHKNHRSHLFLSFSTLLRSYKESAYSYRTTTTGQFRTYVPEHWQNTLLLSPGFGYRLLLGKRKYFDVRYQLLSIVSWTTLPGNQPEFSILFPIPGSGMHPIMMLYGFGVRMGFLFGEKRS
ncbi:MAG: hypothetical protein AAF587_05590 [Bacteroidota bacterium]